jgi:two-component system alkaline phosphatase synthesis response regulator PhoP
MILPDKILVVEDEENIRNLSKMILEGEGYQVITAADGEEGLEKAETEMPDLILLDVVLPGKHGHEVCRTLKDEAKTKNIPIVMCTVLGRDADVTLSTKAGADGHFTKPFKSEGLIAEVKRHLDKSRSQKFSKQLGIEHSRLDGKKILLEFDPHTPYEKLIRDFALECVSNNEEIIVITKKGGAIRQSLEGEKGVEFIDLHVERGRAEESIKQWIKASSPEHHATIIPSILERDKKDRERILNLVFDNLTDLAITTNIQTTYKLTQDAIDSLTAHRATAIFLLNPTAHEAKEVSTLSGLFTSHLTYGKEGIVGVKIT